MSAKRSSAWPHRPGYCTDPLVSQGRAGQGAALSVILAVARFALVGVAVAVIGILVTISWFDGSPRLLDVMVGSLIGAVASIPGAVAVMFAADLVCYFRETRSKN
jgi:predicted anti-sigma-YlaC factor YlaD